MSIEVPSDFAGIDAVKVSIFADEQEFSVGLSIADILSGSGGEGSASVLFADAFVAAFEAEFSEVLNLSPAVGVDAETGSTTVVLSSASGPISFSVEAESQEVQSVTEQVEVAAFTLTGTDGADDVIEVQSDVGFVLVGEAGADTLLGGSGDDTLVGGGGADFVDGGDGSDVLELDGSVGVTAEGGDGSDTVQLVGSTNVASLSGVETVMGSDGSDSITINTNDIETVTGGGGFDAVTLTDASGNTVDLDGVETVMGSTGDDTLTVTDDTSATLDGGLGDDTLVGGDTLRR